jgi:3,4-dihydroxy 2-butanone 4-phosphate synthase/GTP cyclohydrolase II
MNEAGARPAEPTAGAESIEKAVRECLREQGLTRPVVTVTWAQSARGAIAGPGGTPAALSGAESLAMTHRLRAMHDAILVGIRTILSDDPLLSVRLAEGPQPQPVVLDTRLRFPDGARLLGRADRKPWIFHAGGSARTAARLESRGAVLFSVSRGPGGLDLAEVLDRLRGVGVGSLLVEGGAQVLRSFLSQGFAAQLVVTESLVRVEGLAGPVVPSLSTPITARVGADTVTWGRLESGP